MSKCYAECGVTTPLSIKLFMSKLLAEVGGATYQHSEGMAFCSDATVVWPECNMSDADNSDF